MAGIRKVKARAGQIKEITNDEAQKLFEDKAIPEIKVDAIKLPPIPITAEERSKFINHSFGRFPDVQVTDSNGNIIGVDIRHIDDNNIHLSWYGSIVGTIIIN